MESVRKASWPI